MAQDILKEICLEVLTAQGKGGSRDWYELGENLKDWRSFFVRNDLDYITFDSLLDEIDGCEFDLLDVNSYFYALFHKVFVEITTAIEETSELIEHTGKAIDNLRDDFSPALNYMCSCFDNLFNEIDTEKDTIADVELMILKDYYDEEELKEILAKE